MTGPLLTHNTEVPTAEQAASTGERVDEILSRYEGREDELIPVLQQIQQGFGYLPESAMRKVARFLKLPESTVFAVGTFYAQFRLVPSGRNMIRVCRGTACHVRGGPRILREVERNLGIRPGESTPDLEYCLETVACIGACALAPTMVVNNKTHGEMNVKKVAGLLEQIRGKQ